MQTINISERLVRIATYLPSGATFADIGSDHAYLPCYVCKHDNDAYAIAGEINNGPFLRATDTVHSFGLKDQIEVRLGNGLQVLQPYEVKQLVISGMGGALICEILTNDLDKLHMIERIIVQPNGDASLLRKFLLEHHYAVTNEELIEENGHIYEIIIADKIKHVHPLTEKDFFFGPVLLQERPPLFYKKWLWEYKILQKVVTQMRRARKIDQHKFNQHSKEISWIEEVLKDESND